jgi:hypothetical protein
VGIPRPNDQALLRPRKDQDQPRDEYARLIKELLLPTATGGRSKGSFRFSSTSVVTRFWLQPACAVPEASW